MPEEDINIGKYAMLMTRALYPDTNIKEGLERLDKMADTLKRRLEGISEPTEIITILNKYIFTELRFQRYAFQKEDPGENSLLYVGLIHRQGDCILLSIIYLCLAERLKLPIWGVSVPGHFFIRYDDGKNKINIETTTENCENKSNDKYLKMFIPLIKETDTELRERFLKNMTRKEVLSDYLLRIIVNKFGVDALSKEKMYDYKNTAKYLEYVIKLNPNSHPGYRKRGGAFFIWWEEEREKKKENNQYLLARAEKDLQTAYNLYPYDTFTIRILSVVYYFLNDYKSCLRLLNELFQKFSDKEIIEQGTISLEQLREIKKECEEKTGVFSK